MKVKLKAMTSYDDSSIRDLEGLDPIKKRPGMYVGDVTSYKGVYQIIKEAVDNCIIGDTLIPTDRGIVPIEKLCKHNKKGSQPFECEIAGCLGNEKTSHSGYYGIRECKKLITKDGYELSGSLDHPLMSYNKNTLDLEFKRIGNFRQGDIVGIKLCSDLWASYKSGFMTHELARLLGYIVSDGAFKHKFSFFNTNEKVLVDAFKCFRHTFPNASYYLDRNGTSFGSSDEKIAEFFNSIGLYPGKSHNREIPFSILESPKEYVVSFLKAYFEGDGSIVKFDSGGARIEAASLSIKLIKQIQIVLSNFGIYSKIRKSTLRKKIIYKLWVTRHARKFMDDIGFVTKYALLKEDEIIYSYKFPGFTEIINSTIEKSRVGKKKSSWYNTTKGKLKLRLTEGSSGKTRNTTTLEKIEKFIEPLSVVDEELCKKIKKILLIKNTVWVPVEKIINIGKHKVYDFRVPKTRTFIANGIISRNCIDEYLAGFCTTIDIVLDTANNKIAVVDNGRGIPQNSIVRVLTKIHSGGKFDTKAYSVSGGLHGVGISATNALSSNFICYSRRKKIVCAKFKNGGSIIHKERQVSRVLLNNLLDRTQAKTGKWKSGTIVEFTPDYKILTYGKIPVKEIFTWLSTIPKLCPELKINFVALSKNKVIKKVLYSKKGFGDSAKANDFYYSGEKIDCLIKLGGDEEFEGYVNTIPTNDGSHVIGCFKALKSALTPYAKKTLTVKTLKDTVTGIIHVRAESPNFTGQIKEKLGDTRIENIVFETLKEKLSLFFRRRPKIARKIINTAIQIQKIDDDMKSKLKAVRNIENDSKRGKLPIELAVSQTKDKKSRELFIVEGNSAGGTAKAARDRRFQEVLPLRGKLANTEKKKLSQILGSEIKNIILAVGDADPDKGRVGKVIFLADPDPDGQHITALLVTCFIKLFPKWVDEGKIYTVEAPLFHAIYKGRRIFGNTAREVIDQSSKGTNVMRVKGWGEARVDDLKYIAFDSNTRKLIELESGHKTIKKALNIMGKDVSFRKELLGIETGDE